jgi:hypothetical protein
VHIYIVTLDTGYGRLSRIIVTAANRWEAIARAGNGRPVSVECVR